MYAFNDVIGHVDVVIMLARSHVGESASVWHSLKTLQFVSFDVVRLELMRCFVSEDVDHVVEERHTTHWLAFRQRLDHSPDCTRDTIRSAIDNEP